MIKISSEKGVDIQKGMFGLFFEDINYAADGGLYAEMIENRSFESLKNIGGPNYTYDGGHAWSIYPKDAPGAFMAFSDTYGLNENNIHYMVFTAMDGGKSFKNDAYEGVLIEAGKSYTISMYAKAFDYAGKISVKIMKDGVCYGETVVAPSLTGEWTKYEVVYTAEQSVRKGDFVVTLDQPGVVGFDMISCMPKDAVMGLFRRDLAEKLKAIKPGFLRFPGGCIIEGFVLDNRYNWKDTLGDVSERKENWNRWSTHTGMYKNYNQTYGMGFYEYFLLCEYMECKPLPVVNCAMACQYQSAEVVPLNTPEFQQYVQDALDLIEFANGGTDTKYGAIRAKMGHPEPFNMDIIGVGNEQWQTDTNEFFTRYELFEKAIHEKYPEMRLVSTAGPGVQDENYDKAWPWIRENMAKNPTFAYVVDEHYYRTPEWFYDNINFYDEYPREVKVFAGEYASRTRNWANDPDANTWEAALSEAAYLTMVERNADVVYMASYAPLFARLGFTQWSPDMIWFDDAESYATPSYHVQKLYGNNMGTYTLKNDLLDFSKESGVYGCAAFDEETGDIIVKIANSNGAAVEMSMNFEGFSLTGKATSYVIANELMDVNSMADKNRVAPQEMELDVNAEYTYSAPAYSFTVMRVHTR